MPALPASGSMDDPDDQTAREEWATRNAKARAGNMNRLPREPTPGSANPVPRP